jgi:hypothetical protein
MLSGDHHMVGLAHAKNNDIGKFPMAVCGPMDQRNTCKGGTWSYGPFMINGNFGSLEIIDK